MALARRLFLTSVFLCFGLGVNACGKKSEGEAGSESFTRTEPLVASVQIRELRMGIGRHFDLCVDRACYTSGPSEGFYKRDSTGSAWALTDDDGWRGLSEYSVQITRSEATALNAYMSTQVSSGNNVQFPRANNVAQFSQNFAQYIMGGLCLGYVRERYGVLMKKLTDMRGG